MPISANRYFGAHVFEGCPVLELETGRELLRLRESNSEEFLRLFLELEKEHIPARIWGTLLKVASMPAAKTATIRAELAAKRPKVARWLTLYRAIARIEELLLSGANQDQRQQVIERRLELFKAAPPQLVAHVYSGLRKRSRGRCPSTRHIVFRAWEYKKRNPTISWARLAIKFFPDIGPSHGNSLRVQIIELQRELAEVGLR